MFLRKPWWSKAWKNPVCGKDFKPCVWFMFSGENSRFFYLKLHQQNTGWWFFFSAIDFFLHCTLQTNRKGKILGCLKNSHLKERIFTFRMEKPEEIFFIFTSSHRQDCSYRRKEWEEECVKQLKMKTRNIVHDISDNCLGWKSGLAEGQKGLSWC